MISYLGVVIEYAIRKCTELLKSIRISLEKSLQVAIGNWSYTDTFVYKKACMACKDRFCLLSVLCWGSHIEHYSRDFQLYCTPGCEKWNTVSSRRRHHVVTLNKIIPKMLISSFPMLDTSPHALVILFASMLRIKLSCAKNANLKLPDGSLLLSFAKDETRLHRDQNIDSWHRFTKTNNPLMIRR